MGLWRLWPHGGGNGYRCGRGTSRRAARTGRGGAGAPGRRRGATCSGMARPGCGERCTARRCRCRGRARPMRPASRKLEPARPSRRRPRRGRQAGRRRAVTGASPQPSACRLALTEAIAIAPSIPDIHGAGGCGGEDLVRLEAIVLPDKRQVSVKPAAILRCAMASALADWIRTDIAPLAAGLGSAISDLDNFDSFECRGRNRIVGAQTVRARPRQCARRARAQARQWPLDLADRSHRAAGVARNRAAFGLRAVLDRARSGLGLVSRGPHPSRPDGAAQQLPDLPVERVGPAAADRAAVAGGASGGSAAARGRRQIRRCEAGCEIRWRRAGSRAKI